MVRDSRRLAANVAHTLGGIDSCTVLQPIMLIALFYIDFCGDLATFLLKPDVSKEEKEREMRAFKMV